MEAIKTYYALPGPDGKYPRYRFAVLDACVVKEIHDLFLYGLKGIKNADQAARLRTLIATKGIALEWFAADGAVELTWREVSQDWDHDKARRYVAVVDYIHNLSALDRVRVLRGAIPQHLKSAARIRPNAEMYVGIESYLPEFVARYAYLLKAWTLSESRTPWRTRLEELAQFGEDTIGYAPATGYVMGAMLVAGNTKEADRFRKVLKFGLGHSIAKRTRKLRSACWDLQLLNSMVSIPTSFEVAAGVNLRPACAITADGPLALVNGYVGATRSIREGKLYVRLPMGTLASQDRQQAMQKYFQALQKGLAGRRDLENASKMREVLRRSRQYLESQDDFSWSRLIERESAVDSWWNAGEPGNSGTSTIKPPN